MTCWKIEMLENAVAKFTKLRFFCASKYRYTFTFLEKRKHRETADSEPDFLTLIHTNSRTRFSIEKGGKD